MQAQLIEGADDGWVLFGRIRLPNGAVIVTEKRDGCTRTRVIGQLPDTRWS